MSESCYEGRQACLLNVAEPTTGSFKLEKYSSVHAGRCEHVQFRPLGKPDRMRVIGYFGGANVMVSRNETGTSKRRTPASKASKRRQAGSQHISSSDWRAIAATVINRGKDDVVRVDLSAGKVQYDGARIKMHREVRDITGDEEIARAFLIHRLVNELDYPAELIEVERPYEAGRPKNIVPRIDAILKAKSGDAFFFIEAKAPSKFESDKHYIDGQLFKLAGLHQAETGKDVRYLVYYTVEEHDGSIVDKAIVIDRRKYSTFQEWLDAGEPSAGNTLTPKYNKPRKEPLVKKGGVISRSPSRSMISGRLPPTCTTFCGAEEVRAIQRFSLRWSISSSPRYRMSTTPAMGKSTSSRSSSMATSWSNRRRCFLGSMTCTAVHLHCS